MVTELDFNVIWDVRIVACACGPAGRPLAQLCCDDVRGFGRRPRLRLKHAQGCGSMDLRLTPETRMSKRSALWVELVTLRLAHLIM